MFRKRLKNIPAIFGLEKKRFFRRKKNSQQCIYLWSIRSLLKASSHDCTTGKKCHLFFSIKPVANSHI